MLEKAQICLGRIVVTRRDICGSAKRGANAIADTLKPKDNPSM
jgi:hypothetical protein